MSEPVGRLLHAHSSPDGACLGLSVAQCRGELNQVFNWANTTSIAAADRDQHAQAKFLSGFEIR